MKTAFTTCLKILSFCVFVVTLGTGVWGFNWLKKLGVFKLDSLKIEKALKASPLRESTFIFDREGKKLAEWNHGLFIFTPVEKIPNHLKDAVVAIEDRRFYEHHGVDYRGILRAIWARLLGRELKQGASTITQQVARFLLLSREKTIERKVLEIFWAWKLEQSLSKEEILEVYLNRLFLGDQSYGVAAAAKKFFDKDLSDITPAEGALLAGLFQLPSRYNPKKNPELALARQHQVVQAVERYRRYPKDFFSAPIKFNFKKFRTQSSYALDFAKDQAEEILHLENVVGSSLKIYTTIDSNLQKLSESAVLESDSIFSRAGLKSPVEFASLVTNPQTGEVLSLIGGRDYSKSQYNRAVQSLRSPGSAFKPIVYLTALEKGHKWNEELIVSPINIQNYKPKNFENDYLSETTLIRALYKSLNSPTLEVAVKIGLSSILDRAKSLGIQSPLKNEFGSVLGSSGVSLIDMARVYGTFATDGLKTNPYIISKIEDNTGKILYLANIRSQRVAEKDHVQMLNSGLQLVFKYGTAGASRGLLPFVAGKTGTTNDSTDNWFCGFTNDLVGIVWVGTDDHTPLLSNQTGGSLALPIWDKMMRKFFVAKPPSPIVINPEFISRKINSEHGYADPNGIDVLFYPGSPEPSRNQNRSIAGQPIKGSFRKALQK